MHQTAGIVAAAISTSRAKVSRAKATMPCHPGYRPHQLKGERKGIWSVWVSGNSLTFEIEGQDHSLCKEAANGDVHPPIMSSIITLAVKIPHHLEPPSLAPPEWAKAKLSFRGGVWRRWCGGYGAGDYATFNPTNPATGPSSLPRHAVPRRDSIFATVSTPISDEQRNTRSPNLSV
jgi:hypothetical protein